MKLAIKCLVTAVLLWIAFRSVDVVAVSMLLAGIAPAWAIAALALAGAIVVADAYLLAAILRLFDRRLRLGGALLYSIVGWFFSNVAPSTVGGDVFRGVQLSRVGLSVGTAARVVVSQRAVAFATLVMVMIAGLPLALQHASPHKAILIGSMVLASLGALAALLLFVHFPVPGTMVDRWPLLRKLKTASSDLQRLLRPSAQVAAAWLAALVQHLIRVLILACLAAGLHFDISIATLFAFTPAALLVAMVPVSLGGWGVRELTFVYFLGIGGVEGEAALALSIAFGLLRLVVGAIGGLIWVGIDEDYFRVDASSA